MDGGPPPPPPGALSVARRDATVRSTPVSLTHHRRRSQNHSEVLTAISDGMVALLKEFYGRGPTRAKSYYEDDLVVCVLRGGFSRVEQTLLDSGRQAAVIQQRMEFQDLMRHRFVAVIENATGQRVTGFMSGNQPRHHVRGVHPRHHRPRQRQRAAAPRAPSA